MIPDILWPKNENHPREFDPLFQCSLKISLNLTFRYFFTTLFRFLYLLYWLDLIISIFLRWLYFKLLHFLRLGMKEFFTLSFGFLEVLTSKFWVHVLQDMKLSWQIFIAIVMFYSFEVIYFSLIFFLLYSHIFCFTVWINVI